MHRQRSNKLVICFALKAAAIHPLRADALAKTKGGKKAGKGKDKGGKPKKFEGNCFWCGSCGHMMQDC